MNSKNGNTSVFLHCRISSKLNRIKQNINSVTQSRRSSLKKSVFNSVALVRERTIPTERPPPVGEVSANFLRVEGCHVVSATGPHGR